MQIERRRGADRNTVRFQIGPQGSERMVEYRNRQEYRRLLGELPHWDAKLDVRRDDDGSWSIVGRLEPDLCHGQHSLQENELGGNTYWDTADEARAHMAEHEDRLRLELCEDLFTMGLCTSCGAVVPVFGNYVPFAPAGNLVCGECLTTDDGDPAAPAIIHG